MFRVLFVLMLGILLALWVEPSWDPNARTLSLHLRDGAELRGLALDRARVLAERAADEVVSRFRGDTARSANAPRPRGDTPPVASAPRDAPALEELGDQDRLDLDRLVRQKTR